MKGTYRRDNLSVSSTASSSSSTSTSSPGLSPRKHLLSSPTEYLLSPDSPPLSPGLPSLLPRHGKRDHSPLRSQLRRVVVVFGAVVVLTWLALHLISPSRTIGISNGDYEIVSAESLPEEPTAIMLDDRKGRKKWTVSIPAQSQFPLLPSQYHEICQQARHIHQELNPSRRRKRHVGYYERDHYFLDVADAQKQGLLPNTDEHGKIGDWETANDAIAARRVCGKSLTYVMETSDAGMGTTLMGMWMAYGLAQKEGRSFFIDDTRWPYGNYSDYFVQPRLPDCMPPPASQRLPCPHSARHLVVSAATFPFTFGPSFQAQFSDNRKTSETLQNRPMFDLLRAGYEELFHLADESDAEYVTQRTEGILKETREKGGTAVGLHIRRGDLHPLEYQYEKDYLPVTRYMDEAREILIVKYEHDEDEEHEEHGHAQAESEDPDSSSATSPPEPKSKRSSLNGTGLLPRHGAPGMMASNVFLASDDPSIYDAPELSRALRAQDRIVLASKSILEAASSSSGAKKNPWIDEIHGWEGGFYRDQFFGLGRADADRVRYLGKWLSSPSTLETRDHEFLEKSGGVMLEDEDPDLLDPPGEGAMATRQLVGRAYLLDLAVLAHSDAVVCAVSATGCRLLAVMLGWDRAVVQTGWRNVDAGRGWLGLVVPE